jgi:L-ribulose-5-phosphate 3-epimerase
LHMPHHYLKVTYDAGNSAALGYRPQEEFAAYGARIGSVHIKDRKCGGGTVVLGTGDTDFSAVFSGLKALHYTGDFILQVARGVPGHEVPLAEHNRAFVVSHWSETSS